MELATRTLPAQKHITLAIYDHCRKTLMNWVECHQPLLGKRALYATETTGNLIQRATGMDVDAMLSDPMEGDQQASALTSGERTDMLIFFQNLFNVTPHNLDVKALLRPATTWSIPVVISVSVTDLTIQLPNFSDVIDTLIPDYVRYLAERLK